MTTKERWCGMLQSHSPLSFVACACSRRGKHVQTCQCGVDSCLCFYLRGGTVGVNWSGTDADEEREGKECGHEPPRMVRRNDRRGSGGVPVRRQGWQSQRVAGGSGGRLEGAKKGPQPQSGDRSGLHNKQTWRPAVGVFTLQDRLRNRRSAVGASIPVPGQFMARLKLVRGFVSSALRRGGSRTTQTEPKRGASGRSLIREQYFSGGSKTDGMLTEGGAYP